MVRIILTCGRPTMRLVNKCAHRLRDLAAQWRELKNKAADDDYAEHGVVRSD